MNAPSVHEIYGKQAKIILYGESGSGKTYLISRLQNVLVLDAEKGLRSAPGDLKFSVLERDPERPHIPTFEEVCAAPKDEYPSWGLHVSDSKELTQIARILAKPEYSQRFRVVVIDSMTALFDNILSQFRTEYSRGVVDTITSVDGDDATTNLTRMGWGLAQSKLVDALQLLVDLPVHIVWTFHEFDKRTEDGDPYASPMVKGQKMLPQLQAMTDVGFRVEMSRKKIADGSTKTSRKIRCRPSPTAWAKIRESDDHPSLGETEDPDLEAVLVKLEMTSPTKAKKSRTSDRATTEQPAAEAAQGE